MKYDIKTRQRWYLGMAKACLKRGCVDGILESAIWMMKYKLAKAGIILVKEDSNGQGLS